jgi:hypothetical protein
MSLRKLKKAVFGLFFTPNVPTGTILTGAIK